MKNKEILESTSNRKVFNNTHKIHLQRTGKIRCQYCHYHKGDNDTQNWYGGYWDDKTNGHIIKHPSWKLVSKNRKQWMKKPINFKHKKSQYNNRHYIEINW
jgi:hypothetical protein